MRPWWIRLAFLPACGALFACCGSSDIPASVLDQIRQAHLQNLTVDSRIDFLADRRGPGALSPARMERGGLDAAFFFVPVPRVPRTAEGYALAREAALEGIESLREAVRGRLDRVGLGLAPEDAYRLEKEGRRAVFVGLSCADAIGADLSLLAAFHEKGVRLLSLCDASDNAVCDSALDRDDPDDRGLSDLGRSVVAECNRLGLLIDVATCSERSMLDVLAASRSPVVCSRAAAGRLSDVPGNLSDEMIEAIAAHGGVITVTFDRARLLPPGAPLPAKVSDIADHIEHMVKRAGVEGVGIGSCFGGGGGVRGCADPGGMLNLTIELLRRGMGGLALEEIWGANLMRVFKQALVGAGDR